MIDENEAVAQYTITPVDTQWVDTDKAFEGEPMQIRSRIVAREFKSDDRPDLYAGTLPLEAKLKAIISIAAKPQRNVLNHAHRRVTCILPCKGPETRADTATSGGQNGMPTLGKWD